MQPESYYLAELIVSQEVLPVLPQQQEPLGYLPELQNTVR
jgi:hypothetical protein